ncbi:NAD(P)/FAD-dependent oxidoreductase [Bacillus niameyensis]|uniref:NAD(P)/FAD-dependent oxidoreductase n=1 Tax=Bacillus niameyensis TaxID=1522308 RepID=UPI000781BD31|nr:FAD-dependent oxidoreductase [Bacillus niameyensis]
MKQYIVIGAGILGASTAYHLAKKGAKVTVIDRKDEGQATDAAAGIVCPWISQRRNQAWYGLAKNGARYYSELIEELGKEGEMDTGYARVGAISIHKDVEKLIAMEKRAKSRSKDAPEIGDVQILTSSEAKEIFPPLADGYGAVYVSGAARVDGRAIRDALLRAAARNAAVLVNGTAALLIQDDKVIGANTGETEYFADEVIVTNGAWAPSLLKPLGIDIQVDFQKGQIIHMKIPNVATGQWPVIMPPGSHYIVPFHDGRIVAGVTHENNTGFDLDPTISGMNEILQATLEVAPGLEKGIYLETRVGFRPYTPGFLPIIGALPRYKGIFLANGLGSSGLTMGPYLGSELTKLVLGEQTEMNLELYTVQAAMK